jgi:hypothetical protein
LAQEASEAAGLPLAGLDQREPIGVPISARPLATIPRPLRHGVALDRQGGKVSTLVPLSDKGQIVSIRGHHRH